MTSLATVTLADAAAPRLEAAGLRRESARTLADCAVRALIEEVLLTPKPALVDQRGPGAHHDLDLGRLLRSARALHAPFRAMALVAHGRLPDAEPRETLGAVGRRAAARARLPDCRAPNVPSSGRRVCAIFRVAGARGEAAAGFPHVVDLGLPQLRRARDRGCDETSARLDVLLAIMASLDDTCLLHRGGLPALEAAQRGARRALALGGSGSAAGRRALLELDAELLGLRASPGGAADLLAACLFLDATT